MRKFNITVEFEESNCIHVQFYSESGYVPVEYQGVLEVLYDSILDLLSEEHLKEIIAVNVGGDIEC